MKKVLVAELLGTFILVFAGCGAIVVNEHTQALGHFGVATVWGLVVFALIEAFGSLSGAHFNPAVSLAFAVAKRFEFKKVLPYSIAQILGAFLAIFALQYLFPHSLSLGSALPHAQYSSDIKNMILEFGLTFFLMYVIMQVSSGFYQKGLIAGIAIGVVVLLEALFAGPICGASMNPARSLAPAIVSGQIQALWQSILGIYLGAISSVFVWSYLNKNLEKKS